MSIHTSVSSILVVRIGAIGDVVMALSVLPALRREYPSAKVTWLCGKTVAGLLGQVEDIDEVIVLDDAQLLAGNYLEKLLELGRTWLKLFGSTYDLLLLGHGNSLYTLLVLTVRSKTRRSFSYKGRIWPVKGRYHADEFTRLATNVDGPMAVRGTFPKIKKDLSDAVKQYLPRDLSNFVALAPGGARNTMRDDALRRWPLSNYVKLAAKLIQRGTGIIITGSEGDGWVRRSFESYDCIDIIGKTSLADLVAIYAMCPLVITHDSGPMHLAELAGTNVIALFGPTLPSEKVRPNSNTSVFWSGSSLPCCPCYDGKNYSLCSDNVCMQMIGVDQVLARAIEFLDAPPA